MRSRPRWSSRISRSELARASCQVQGWVLCSASCGLTDSDALSVQVDETRQQEEAAVASDVATVAAAAMAGQDADEEDLLKQAIAMSMADGEEFDDDNMGVRCRDDGGRRVGGFPERCREVVPA